MIRDDKFLISRRPYAVNLSSLRANKGDGDRSYYCIVDAVWFRRRYGVTAACIGTLWDLQREEPADAVEFLARHTDGRYGGRCIGRWDGKTYWGDRVTPDVMNQHLAILRPMLENYPNAPEGYDGWWRF